jgi:hypothetical protein
VNDVGIVKASAWWVLCGVSRRPLRGYVDIYIVIETVFDHAFRYKSRISLQSTLTRFVLLIRNNARICWGRVKII